jgi:hypothetical protein
MRIIIIIKLEIKNKTLPLIIAFEYIAVTLVCSWFPVMPEMREAGHSLP